MASSTNKKGTTSTNRKTNSGKSNSTKKSSSSSAAAKRKQLEKQRQEQEELKRNIIWIAFGAMMLFLFLCNFGIVGSMGNAVSGFLFGVFGLLAYITPLLIFLLAIYIAICEDRFQCIRNILLGSAVYVLLGISIDFFSEKVSGLTEFSGTQAYEVCKSAKNGGGIIMGAITHLLCGSIGKVGTVLLVLLGFLICLFVFFRRSPIALIQDLIYDWEEEQDLRRQENDLRREEKAFRREERTLRRKEEIEQRQLLLEEDNQRRLVRQSQKESFYPGYEEMTPQEQEIAEEMSELQLPEVPDFETKPVEDDFAFSYNPFSKKNQERRAEKKQERADKKEAKREQKETDSILKMVRNPFDEDLLFEKYASDSDFSDEMSEITMPEDAQPRRYGYVNPFADESGENPSDNMDVYDAQQVMNPSRQNSSEQDAHYRFETKVPVRTQHQVDVMPGQDELEWQSSEPVEGPSPIAGFEVKSVKQPSISPEFADLSVPIPKQEIRREVEKAQPVHIEQSATELPILEQTTEEPIEGRFEEPVEAHFDESFEEPIRPSTFSSAEKNKNTTPESVISSEPVKARNEIEPSMPKAVPVRPVATNQETTTEPTYTQSNSSAGQAAVSKTSQTVKEYCFPPIDLLNQGKVQTGDSTNALIETAQKLKKTLADFGVAVEMGEYTQGPSVTRFELVPAPGVKVAKIVGLTDDIKLALAATDIRIEAPIPGKQAIGIEVPNKENSMVALRDLIDSKEFSEHSSRLAFAVGKNIGGKTIVHDIGKMPHVLIAGATGSGKSVCINTLIMSLIYKSDPKDVQMIMIDPKVVELSVYNGIPHLLQPVVTKPKDASGALKWAVKEMEKRYQLFADMNVRDLKGYNEKVLRGKATGEQNIPMKLPQIVIIIDELADLMMVCPGEVEESICRLAQLARAAGIHLVVATQRPSVDVITGLIKANMPSRIAFAVSSGVDSRTILDSVGAEKLLGKGDMLFYPQGYSKPERLQGAFVSDDEVSAVVEFLVEQKLGNAYADSIQGEMRNCMDSENEAGSNSGNGSKADASATAGDGRDEYFEQAALCIIQSGKASIGYLQRMLKIGFNRAARIMDDLAKYGIVGPEQGTKPRDILMNEDQFKAFLQQEDAVEE